MLSTNSHFNDNFELLKAAFRLFRFSFCQVIGLSAASAFFIFAPYFFSMMHLVNNQKQLVFIFVLSWPLGLVLMNALIFQLYCKAYAFPNSFLQSLTHALKKMIPLLLLCLLYLMIVLAGTMLLVIPGIILAISMMFSFILLIIDNQNILQTLLTSHRLVWGKWWHTSYIISFPILLNIVLTLGALMMLLAIFHFASLSIITFNAFGIFIGMLLQACLMPFTFSMAIVLLHDLRQKMPNPSPTW